jgi:pimeloyl-ACP methyl ester carboxylesterase
MVATALHVDVLGVGAPMRALVLHGLGSDCRTMWQLTSHLVNLGHEVHAADLRGHGRSPAMDRYAVLDMVDDVALLGDGWDLVVGHSLGGAILASLLTKPGFAARAVLIDPAISIVGEAATFIAELILSEVGGGLTAEALLARSPGWHPEDRWRKVAASALVSPHVIESCVKDSQPWSFQDTFARWQCPVHILAADPDLGALFDPATIPGIEDLAHVTVTTVLGAGHSIHRDDAAAVLAALA